MRIRCVCYRAGSPPLELTAEGLYFECRASVRDHLVFGSLPPTAVPTYVRPGRSDVLGTSTHRPPRHNTHHLEGAASLPKSALGSHSDRAASRYFDNSVEATAMRDRRRRRVQLSLDPKRLRRQAQANELPAARLKSDEKNMSLIPVGPVLLGDSNAAHSSGHRDHRERSNGGDGEGDSGPVLRSDFEGAEEVFVARTLAFNLEV